MNQVEIRESLLEALEADLVGPMAEDEVLPVRPSRWYLTGFLVPYGAADEQRYDPQAMEQLASGPEGDSDDDRGDQQASVSRPFLPSSCGVSVMVPPDCNELEVEARWGEYERLSGEESLRWRDRGGDSEEPPDSDDESGDGEKIRFRYWRRARQRAEVITLAVKPQNSGLFLDANGVQARLITHDTSFQGLPPGARVVSVFLVNAREAVSGANADASSLFQVELRVRCAQGLLARTHYEGTPHIDDRRNDLQFRDKEEWAVGHGAATLALPSPDGVVREVSTTWFPRARVYRMNADDDKGVLLEMEGLAGLPDAAALSARMGALLEGYRGWIEAQRRQLPELSEERRETAGELLEEAEKARARIARGLEVLAADPLAFEAFRLTNTAMAMAARQVRKKDYPEGAPGPKWRLFQLAFLLLNVAGIADPDDAAERGAVELLFFPTGGGKTEAYLGVAAFTMLLRRLTHREDKHRGAGVTVILRYTLRLLTLDQLGRAATLACAMELLRLKDPQRLGDRRFAVGLWVGRKATPNKLDDAAQQIRDFKNPNRRARTAPPVPLVGCPWCERPFEPEGFDVIKDGKRVEAIRAGCTNWECEFSLANNPDGLPVVSVDEQIYRELPAFLIGTVDKFALLPWRGDTGTLFGRVQAFDEKGFYGEHEQPPRKARKLSGGLPPPALIIQDELHLITGPLGTMVGLYETVVDYLCRDAQGRGPKLIASTATARRAAEQIQALYGRDDTRLFPPQGLNDGDTFFAKSEAPPRDATPEMIAASLPKARLYVGVAAPGRSMKAVIARVYSTLLSAAYRRWYGKAASLDNAADTYMTLVAYFNSLRDLGGCQRLVLEEVSPRVSRMERRHPVSMDEAPWFRDRRLDFDVLELTSRQDTRAVREAKGRLEAGFGTPEGGHSDVLLASSMISVGVDIPRLGLMVVNGQPRTVAEYIQASSRVGRRTPGLVVTLYNLYKPRDRSHYERFTAFHECFYRYIEASSVTPFSARAVDRGLAGLTVSLARHTQKGLADPAGAERIAKAAAAPDELARVLSERVLAHREGAPDELAEQVSRKLRELLEDWKELADDMAAHSAPLSYSAWEGRKGSRYLLSATDEEASVDANPLFERFKAPTSMRDVEPTVHLWVGKVTTRRDS